MLIDTKEKNHLVDALEGAGAKFKNSSCSCPFHQDKNPSAGIYKSKEGNWRFKCQVCNHNFDVIGTMAYLQGVEPAEILKENGTLTENHFHHEKKLTESEIKQKYSRANGWRYLHEYKDLEGSITHFVAIKYLEKGKQVFQFKRYGFNFVMRNTGKRPIFNMNEIKDENLVVMVEGEKSANALKYVGIPATTCMGGSQSVSQSDLSPLNGKRVILWPDNDKAGTEYATSLKTELEKLECNVGLIDIEPLMLPEKGDSADFIGEFLKSYTREEVKEEIENLIANVKIDSYAERYSEGYLKDLENGSLTSLQSDWHCLEQTKWLRGGTVTLVCAPAGTGKSYFVNNLAINSHKAGYKAINLQLEENQDYHVSRAFATEFGVDLTDPDSATQQDIDFARANLSAIEDFGRVIKTVDDSEMTLVAIAEKVRKYAEDGADLIIVDPISIAEKSARSWEDDLKFVNMVKREVRIHKTRVVLVTHPKGGQGKEINLDSLAGGTAYQRLSQCVLWLQRIEETGDKAYFGRDGVPEMPSYADGNIMVICMKARNAGSSMASNKFLFDFTKGKFTELGYIPKEQK